MKAALKRGVETGTLIQVKASYKLSAEAKKKATSTKAEAKVEKKKSSGTEKKGERQKVRLVVLVAAYDSVFSRCTC